MPKFRDTAVTTAELFALSHVRSLSRNEDGEPPPRARRRCSGHLRNRTQNSDALTTTGFRIAMVAALLGSTLFLSACGGGGGGTASGGTVSGTVVKGPLGAATVTAYAITGGTMGAPVGSGSTDSVGNFSFSIGDYAGPLMLQASGGTYTDEARGTMMTMQAGDVMACAIPSVTAGVTTAGILVTPLTSMAHARVHHMSGGITAANITTANAAVGTYFSVSDILHTMPMDPMVAGSGTGATQDMKNYGMSIAAMSQYAETIGIEGHSVVAEPASGHCRSLTRNAARSALRPPRPRTL